MSNELVVIDGNLLDADVSVIAHQTNCYGVMGAGIAKQIRERSPRTFLEYRELCSPDIPKEYLLGHAQIVNVAGDFPYAWYVANLFSQYGCFNDDGRATNYFAFALAFNSLIAQMYQKDITGTIGIPYGIGCGLAGGDFSIVSTIINDALAMNDGVKCVAYRYVPQS